MFNVQGSEIIIIVLVALIVLGPEKLPDAIRRVSKAYAEIRKMSNGFQSELRSALDEPLRELRDTADLVRKNADFRDLVQSPTTPETKPAEPGPASVTPAAAASTDGPPTAPAPGLDPVVAAEQADRGNAAEAAVDDAADAAADDELAELVTEPEALSEPEPEPEPESAVVTEVTESEDPPR